ncbi:MAG: CHAP domain-containing protein, partial [Wujia sp.]
MRNKSIKKTISKFLAAVMAVGVMSASGVGQLTSKAAPTANQVVSTAASQVGYHEKASYDYLDDFTANSGSANYNKYARDIGIANGQPWCATFVWWCMQVSGVPSDSYPQTAWVPSIKSWFSQRGAFRARGTYVPKGGDYIIFGDSSHVGIVEYVADGQVHTIEGNTSDSVARRTYWLDSTYILGYGIMNYAVDNVGPSISDIAVYDISEDGYTVSCKVDDDYGIYCVAFPTWTVENGQDDIDPNWYMLSGNSMGQLNGNIATFRVNVSEHGNEMGIYATHIYAHDNNGNVTAYTEILVDIQPPVAEEPDTTEETTDEIGNIDAAEPENDETTGEESTEEETTGEESTEEVTTEEEIIEDKTTEVESTEEIIANDENEILSNNDISVNIDNSTTNIEQNVTNVNNTNTYIENNYIENNAYYQDLISNYEPGVYEDAIVMDNEEVQEHINNEFVNQIIDTCLQAIDIQLSNYIPEDFVVEEMDEIESTVKECDIKEDSTDGSDDDYIEQS